MGRVEINGLIEFFKGFIVVVQLDKGNTFKMVNKGIRWIYRKRMIKCSNRLIIPLCSAYARPR